MNKISFRAKRADNKEWEYGYYACIGPTGEERHYIIPSYASAFYGIEIDPETVGQYISEIDAYVGDILYGNEEDEYGTVISEWEGVIQYNDATGRYMIEDDTGIWCEIDEYVFYKISGNIFDDDCEVHYD